MRPDAKSPDAALVVVPPAALWPSIDSIRSARDPQAALVPPHVTLLYPFVPEAAFAEAVPRIAEACARMPPFALTLARFGAFERPSGERMLWLDLEPRGAVVALHAALRAAFPAHDDTARYPDGFQPHLTVGEATAADADALLAELARTWAPVRFEVTEVTLLARTPGEPFRVAARARLGG